MTILSQFQIHQSEFMIIALGCWYLEETEATRIELVFALSVLKGQELDELFDKHWVCEMVIDDAFPLLENSLHSYKFIRKTKCREVRLRCVHVYLIHVLSSKILRLLCFWGI